MPTYLEETVPLLDARPELGIVTTHVELFGNRQGIWQTSDYAPTTLLWQNCIASASLFRKICWQQTRGYPDLPAYQDWSFWISIVEQGWKWAVIPKVLFRYRVRDGSITSQAEGWRKGLLKKWVQLVRLQLAKIPAFFEAHLFWPAQKRRVFEGFVGFAVAP